MLYTRHFVTAQLRSTATQLCGSPHRAARHYTTLLICICHYISTHQLHKNLLQRFCANRVYAARSTQKMGAPCVVQVTGVNFRKIRVQLVVKETELEFLRNSLCPSSYATTLQHKHCTEPFILCWCWQSGRGTHFAEDTSFVCCAVGRCHFWKNLSSTF